MASFNPLAMILNQKPLDGNNFEDWKTNLYIVLYYKKIKFVLDTPKPVIPKAGANDITKTEHATWENANTSLRCYILACSDLRARPDLVGGSELKPGDARPKPLIKFI